MDPMTQPTSSIVSGGDTGKAGNKKRKMWIALIAIVLVLGAGIALAVALTTKKTPQDVVGNTANLSAVGVSVTASGMTPASVTVKAGQQITFTNDDTEPHQLTAEQTLLSGFDSIQELNNGDSYTYTFEKTGTYHYYDAQNPTKFNGTVVVE